MSVGHPQTNGMVEVTNQTIIQRLRTKLDESKGRWVDELFGVLWAYHMIPRTTINEIPFNLAFSTKTVIPVEVRLPTM